MNCIYRWRNERCNSIYNKIQDKLNKEVRTHKQVIVTKLSQLSDEGDFYFINTLINF